MMASFVKVLFCANNWGNIRKAQIFFVPLHQHSGVDAIGLEKHEPINLSNIINLLNHEEK